SRPSAQRMTQCRVTRDSTLGYPPPGTWSPLERLHPMTTDTATKILGTRIRRREDPRLITGAGIYTDDLHLPGMAYMALLRSPYGHARIISIDTSAAKAVPG